MPWSVYVACYSLKDNILKGSHPFKPVPHSRELGLRGGDIEHDHSGVEDSFPESDFLSDASCEIGDDDQQLVSWKSIEVCRFSDNDVESIYREDQAVRCDAGSAGRDAKDGDLGANGEKNLHDIMDDNGEMT